MKASEMTKEQLASYIDYSVLKPEFTEEQIIELTKDGVKRACATICINPGYVALCDPLVKGSQTGLCPVCDFPFGTSSTASRLAQAKEVVGYESVKDVDFVINYGYLRAGKTEAILADLKALTDFCHQHGKNIKIILETDALTKEQIILGCELCVQAGVDFVKTSTGFLTGYEAHGATLEVIQLMRSVVQDKCKIKGSGCIRTREHFLALIDLGIDRMGIGYKSVPVVLGDSEK